MPIYNTAADWAAYFGNRTADQHKILVDILNQLEQINTPPANTMIEFDTVAAQQAYQNNDLIGADIGGIWFGAFRVTNYTFDGATGTITFDDTVDDVVNVLVILK